MRVGRGGAGRRSRFPGGTLARSPGTGRKAHTQARAAGPHRGNGSCRPCRGGRPPPPSPAHRVAVRADPGFWVQHPQPALDCAQTGVNVAHLQQGGARQLAGGGAAAFAVRGCRAAPVSCQHGCSMDQRRRRRCGGVAAPTAQGCPPPSICGARRPRGCAPKTWISANSASAGAAVWREAAPKPAAWTRHAPRRHQPAGCVPWRHARLAAWHADARCSTAGCLVLAAELSAPPPLPPALCMGCPRWGGAHPPRPAGAAAPAWCWAAPQTPHARRARVRPVAGSPARRGGRNACARGFAVWGPGWALPALPASLCHPRHDPSTGGQTPPGRWGHLTRHTLAPNTSA